MKVENTELLCYLNDLLHPEKIRDYAPNGLQVEGRRTITKMVTGVTASQALIEQAIALEADAIFVHHGYFWKGEDACIRGMKRKRLAALLSNDINLYAYHLPLDVHPVLGNNVQLAKLLGIKVEGGLEQDDYNSVPLKGHFEQPVTLTQLGQRVEQALGRTPLLEGNPDKILNSVAWCTGGGQGYIDLAAAQQLDVFISGEVSEQTIHTARECDISFVAAGHHATERYGAKSVGEHLAEEFGIEVVFVDIDNPV